MKTPLFKNFTLISALFAVGLGITTALAVPTTFTGSYTQNFDSALGGGSTAMPAGFRSMVIAGGNATYSASTPISTAGIASATVSSQTLVVWEAGNAVRSSGTILFNCGWFGNSSDRSLGTDPSGTAANIIELSMTNNTGDNLAGVTFSYACKCLTNGSAGTEASELPGYSFFYSLTGSTTASDWIKVTALANGNYTQGTSSNTGPVNIIFATPLANNGIMYFRWADDNNQASSPDQQLAIDNISISSYNPNGPLVSLTSPTNNARYIPGSNITVTATAAESGGTITNVAFYSGATLLGNVANSPYSLVWSNVTDGAYALTAVASDAGGIMTTSVIVNITVAHLAPTVAITNPTSGAAYAATASIALTATAADTDGNVTNVAFYSGATLLANVASAPYSYTWLNVPAGSYSLVAVAAADTGASATSSAVSVTVTNPLVASFTGTFTENFDLDLTNSTTVMPPGFQAMYLPGSNFTYTNGIPIDSNAIVTATVGSGAPTLVAWNAGDAVNIASYQLFNVGCWDSLNNRALGTDPSGTAGTVIQLALKNNSGNSLNGVTFSYTERCLTNGSTSNGAYTDDGTERLELPGYSFFYSLTGDTQPTNWFSVDALAQTNWVQGTSSDSGPVTITFPTPLPANGVMYFRWADDNCVGSSPDQMFAIDNISITANNNTNPVASITSPTNNANFLPGTNITITASAAEFGGAITNVEFFANAIDLGGATNAPYGLTWSNVIGGNYALTVVASDAAGLTATSAVVNITVSIPNVPPTASLISPTNHAAFNAPASITLSASASDSDGTVTNVAFYQGATLIANAASAPYNFTWTNVAAGTYSVTAVATDNSGASTTSTAANITVVDLAALQKLQQIKTVFVIAMENHNFNQIQGNAAAPYINSLITAGNSNAVQVSYAMKYYNAGIGVHPSEPNYIWAEAGSDFGWHSDADPGSGNTFSAPHLTAQLNTAGIAWKNYEEDVQFSSSANVSASGSGPVNPYNGSTTVGYAAKHNPMAFFTDTQVQNVYAISNFVKDLTNSTVGSYNWITPNMDNDMHDGLSSFSYHGTTYTGDQAAIAEGDNFLSIVVPQIMASAAYNSNGVIILRWDETEGGDSTAVTIPEIIISPLAKGNAYASNVEYNHSSDLKTMEEIFSLPFLTNAIPAGEYNASGSGYNNVANVNDLSDMFQLITAPTITVPTNIIAEATNAAGNAVSFTVTASDAIDGALAPIITPASGSVFPPGTNIITAIATNSHNLSATNSFKIIVRDTTPPVITLNGANPDTNFQGVAFVDPGATAIDIVSGSVPVTTNSTVNVSTPGTYAVQYIASDAAGNSSTNTRAVQVIALPVPASLGGAPVAGDGRSAFHLSFSAAIGQPYRILGSDVLSLPATNWTVLASGVCTNNPVSFTDLGAVTNATRFYRVVSP